MTQHRDCDFDHPHPSHPCGRRIVEDLVVVLPERSEDWISEALRRLTGSLRATGAVSHEGLLGGANGYGVGFANHVFTMRQHTEDPPECDCGADEQTEPPWRDHAPDCACDLPNFKCGKFEVRWHKWIGRSMKVSRAALSDAEIREIFALCRRSIGADE